MQTKSFRRNICQPVRKLMASLISFVLLKRGAESCRLRGGELSEIIRQIRTGGKGGWLKESFIIRIRY